MLHPPEKLLTLQTSSVASSQHNNLQKLRKLDVINDDSANSSMK